MGEEADLAWARDDLQISLEYCEEAIFYLEGFVLTCDNDAETLCWIARCDIVRGEHVAALPSLEELRRLDPVSEAMLA